MQVMALIYADEAWWDGLDDRKRGSVYDEYRAFGEKAGEAGVVAGGDQLVPTRDATTVRVRDGQMLVSDGPYAEVKEALGGYYLLDVASLDDAVEWAAMIPGAAHGAVEVRAVHADPQEVQL